MREATVVAGVADATCKRERRRRHEKGDMVSDSQS